jgi:glycerophosphoryl diester phosphodiesterase
MQTRSGLDTPQGFLAAIAFVLGSAGTNLHATPVNTPANTDTVRHQLAPPVVAAHRAGFFERGSPLQKAQATLQTDAAQVLEMDLRLTLDGIVIVSHDDALSGKGTCVGPVETFTYAALAECERTIHKEPATRFEDVLAAVDGRAVVNAEFKTQEVIAPAIALVHARHATPWVYFQATGDLTKYHMARQLDPEVALLLKVTSDEEIQQAIDLHDPNLIILELDRDFVTPERVAQIHAANMLVSENSFRYQFTEERFTASCNRVFGLGIDIAVTNNASRCSAQRPTWRTHMSGYRANPFDRQHLRADFHGHKRAMEVVMAGIASLGIALVL